MSVEASVIDLTSDDTSNNAAKRPIELLDESSDDEKASNVPKSRRRGFRLKRSWDDVVVVETVNLLEDNKVPAKSPIMQVLEVFPDVCTDHANQLLKLHSNVASVLQILADSASYPKATTKPINGKIKPFSLIAHRHEEGDYAYDFLSESSFVPDPIYCKEAMQLLQQDFKFLSDKAISVHFSLAKQHYAICHDKICRALMLREATPKDEEVEWEQYAMLQRALSCVSAINSKQLTSLWIKGRLPKKAICMTNRRPCDMVKLSHDILKEESRFVQDKQDEVKSRMDSYQERRSARRLAEATSSTIECNCCYTDVSADEMVQCRAGHLFCCSCLRKMSETQIFGNGNFGIHPITKEPATELLCMAGCGAGFLPNLLSKALPKQVLLKYNEMQFQVAVCKAHMEDLCSCPKCGYQAVLPASEMIFRCPVGDCSYESCRKCGEDPHIPLSCDEAKQTNDGRLKVEEAISQSRIRTCPKPGCMKKFVKESGCNKMTCACGTHSCYMCRKVISFKEGYSHFCSVPLCDHAICGKCVLYSNAEQDDERAMREAGVKAAEEVRAASLIESSKGAVAISVDDILKMPPSSASTAPHPRGDPRLLQQIAAQRLAAANQLGQQRLFGPNRNRGRRR